MRLELSLKDLTLTTLISLFSSVTSLVSNETRAVANRLPAVTALIRPFSSVNSPVLKECQAIAKWFPTLPQS